MIAGAETTFDLLGERFPNLHNVLGLKDLFVKYYSLNRLPDFSLRDIHILLQGLDAYLQNFYKDGENGQTIAITLNNFLLRAYLKLIFGNQEIVTAVRDYLIAGGFIVQELSSRTARGTLRINYELFEDS